MHRLVQLVRPLHACHVYLMDCAVIDDRFWIVDADYAARLLLHADGGGPRLEYVLCGHLLQRRYVLADVVPVFVILFAKRDGRVHLSDGRHERG